MTINQWMHKRKTNEFIVLFPVFALSYWLVDLIWHRFLGGSRTHWLEVIFWGAAMSVTTAYNGLFRGKNSDERS